ncbi:hypothetical protein Celaphus_00003785 [Cervus elaphus hippelaphus]|uniref:Uncharacterized protein n=1 Tax=Cervus elaphus hippelaphus TaxID=46360 RepID=A0A212D2P1_CEREH|nr:hypothetical protein Celaphus_00003785 [Cervus elaphus hippelaphus]
MGPGDHVSERPSRRGDVPASGISKPGSYPPSSQNHFRSTANSPPAITGDLREEGGPALDFSPRPSPSSTLNLHCACLQISLLSLKEASGGAEGRPARSQLATSPMQTQPVTAKQNVRAWQAVASDTKTASNQGRQKTAEELLGKSPTKAPLESQFKSVFRQWFCEERSPRTGVTVASDSAHLCCPKQCAQLRLWPVTRGGTPQAHEDQEAPHFTLIWFMRSWSGTFLMNQDGTAPILEGRQITGTNGKKIWAALSSLARQWTLEDELEKERERRR